MNFNQNIVPTINLLNSSCIPTDVLMYMFEFSNDKNKLLSLDKKSYNKFSPPINHRRKMKSLMDEIIIEYLDRKYSIKKNYRTHRAYYIIGHIESYHQIAAVHRWYDNIYPEKCQPYGISLFVRNINTFRFINNITIKESMMFNMYLNRNNLDVVSRPTATQKFFKENMLYRIRRGFEN
jgi:hypothetical protein